MVIIYLIYNTRHWIIWDKLAFEVLDETIASKLLDFASVNAPRSARAR